jgi:hypothetical protein
MASIFTSGATGSESHVRRISRHIASALVVFAVLQIFVVAMLGGSLLLHFGIIVSLGLFAVMGRALERRWTRLSAGNLPEAGLATRFRMDILTLWGLSLLAPMLWIPVKTVADALFG